jgi:hypothetical protein
MEVLSGGDYARRRHDAAMAQLGAVCVAGPASNTRRPTGFTMVCTQSRKLKSSSSLRVQTLAQTAGLKSCIQSSRHCTSKSCSMSSAVPRFKSFELRNITRRASFSAYLASSIGAQSAGVADGGGAHVDLLSYLIFLLGRPICRLIGGPPAPRPARMAANASSTSRPIAPGGEPGGCPHRVTSVTSIFVYRLTRKTPPMCS